jgi:hypothetical protein
MEDSKSVPIGSLVGHIEPSLSIDFQRITRRENCFQNLKSYKAFLFPRVYFTIMGTF